MLSALGIPVPVGDELDAEEEAAAHAFQALGIAEGEGAQEQNALNAGVGTAPTPQEVAPTQEEVAAVVALCREEVGAGAAQCEAQRHPEGALPPCTGAARPPDAVLQRCAESGAKALRTFLTNVEEAKQLLLEQKSMLLLLLHLKPSAPDRMLPSSCFRVRVLRLMSTPASP